MMSMANLDKVLHVDTEEMTVTAQAGARVSQVVEALRPYGLTLPNLASIAEQQMGGFVQVGAHGTGRCIAPVDHYVTKLKIVTPAQGTITLTEEDGEKFHLAKVGLGCLGVVVEVTMKCVPAHKLVEHTFVLTRKEAKEQLQELLKKHKHMRYMWIPYTDAVVFVTNDPEDMVPDIPSIKTLSEEERYRPLIDLLIALYKDSAEPFTKESVKGMGFGEIRDALLAINPLDMDHVKRCNEAEAEFWRRSEGYQVKPSDQLLQFDCGGQVRSGSVLWRILC
jgi:L-galactono-1,4-lactone dehydrogenase